MLHHESEYVTNNQLSATLRRKTHLQVEDQAQLFKCAAIMMCQQQPAVCQLGILRVIDARR
jgi:hypothetical protein